jgi:LCP family protein required for cell wall assembly
MAYFRQPKNNKNSSKSIDGFIPRNPSGRGDSGRVQQRFRTSYKPRGTSLDGLKRGREDFTTRQSATSFQADTTEEFESQEIEQAINNTGTVPKKSFFSRKKNKSKKDKKITFKKASKAFAIFLIATLIGVGSLFTYGYIKARNIFRGDGNGAAALQQNVDPSRLNGEGDGRVNILVLGKGGPGETAPDLTDTLLLASIDPVQNEAALVSVPRDMYVQDQNKYSTKINAIYSNAKQARLANGNESDSDKQAAEDAGLSAVKTAVSEVLGIPVHYYVMVDFKAFEDAINTVGGITVDVKEPLYDQTVAWLLDGNPLVADEGLQTFDGKRALLYARSRKGSARGDFDRTERQREIIVALQNKVLSAGTYSNPFKVVELLSTFGDRVRTDLNGLEEIKRLYEIGQQIGPDKIASVGLADPPNVLVTTDFINGQSVVVPREGLYQYDEIHNYIRNNLRDAFLKSEDAKVIILNGTTITGLATATSEELKSYGYNVVSVDNAPTSTYIKNQLIELNPGENKYTKSYIERRLGLQATTQAPVGIPDKTQADFVIILGTDEATKTTN